ncbi:MAG: biotin/lipoyl-binding protein [Pirellulaceae bacterium]|nr:biotin/lipoyl-binding protein [Pirellulaceae bacterium]
MRLDQATAQLTDGPKSAPKILELDAAAIAQTKVQISSLVAEIAELARTCEAPKAFYSAMLSRLVTAMAGSGAGVWQQFDDGSWKLVQACTLPDSLVTTADELSADIRARSDEALDRISSIVEHELDFSASRDNDANLGQTALKNESVPTPEHLALLDCVARERQPILVPPGNLAASSDRPTNPLQQCLIYSPIPVDVGFGRLWLQVVQSPSGGVATQRGYLRFVAQIADLTADFLKTFHLRHFESEKRLFVATQQLLGDLANPGDSKAKLVTLLLQLREFTGADQVILIQRISANKKWQLLVASGVRDFDKRSEASQCFSELGKWFAQRCSRNQAWLVYATDRRTQPSTSDRSIHENSLPLDRFFSMFSASAVGWLPMIGGTSTNPNGFGCILHWSWPTKKPDNAYLEQVANRALVLGRIGLAAIRPPQLKMALDRDVTPSNGLGVWAKQMLSSVWIRFAIAAMLVVGISIISVPLRIVAPATIHPRLQYRHYAPLDGRITKVHVEYGQAVVAGQVLLELEDRQLSNLLDDAITQQLKSKERRRDIKSRLLRGDRLSIDTRYELEGEQETLQALASDEQHRVDELQRQMQLLTIRSAEDGVVATWNIKELLQDRPVRVGQMLLLVQQPNGPWVVDARIRQQDVGRFLESVRNGSTLANCSLSSHPNRVIPAVYQPSLSTETILTNQDDGNSSALCVQFAVPVDELPQRNTGSAARVTVDIGRGPLVWSVFGNAIVSFWAKVRLWI